MTHVHDEDCAAHYREWLRYDRIVGDSSGRIDANTIEHARRERDMFERQLRAIGCSSEARSQDE